MAFKTLYAAEDFDDLDEFFDCVSVDLFVVWRRFTKTSRPFQSTDGDYSSTRVFPGVPFDSESSKENQSKAMVVIFPVLGCTVWQWVKQVKSIKSPFSLYISRYVNVRKQKNRHGVSWLCHYSTPTNGTSWETIPSENNNGLILYAKSTLHLQAYAAEQVDTDSNITSSNNLRESKVQRSLE